MPTGGNGSRAPGPAPSAARCSRMSPEPGVHPFQASSPPGRHSGHQSSRRTDGRQEIAPRVAHQALHLTLVIALAGAAEPVIEQVVGLELGEGPGALAPTVAQDPGNSQPGIVVEDALRRSPRKAKPETWPSWKASMVSAGLSLDEAAVAVGQVDYEAVAFRSTPPMMTRASPKSHWAWPGGWDRGTNISCDRRRCSLT